MDDASFRQARSGTGRVLGALTGEPVEVARFLDIATAIAAALERAHANAGVHGDIRPEAIVLDEQAGTARLVDPPPALAGERFAYASPEAAGRGVGDARELSDLYSLGVVFYELLAGERPFRSSDALGWTHHHAARSPPDVARARPDVPPGIAAVVMRLLAKRPEDRYPSAGALRADLERCHEVWRLTGSVGLLALGTPPAAISPRQLYGREPARVELAAALAQVRQGNRCRLVVIHGQSGAGKSALAAVMPNLVSDVGGRFGAGKFAEGRARAPYSAICAALADVVAAIAAEQGDDESLRAAVVRTGGSNLGLVLDALPGLERFTG